jgi:hypothetical protein
MPRDLRQQVYRAQGQSRARHPTSVRRLPGTVNRLTDMDSIDSFSPALAQPPMRACASRIRYACCHEHTEKKSFAGTVQG